MKPSAAVQVAERVLAGLIARPDDLAQFLIQTGAAPDDLRAPTLDTDLARAILDHVMGDEALLLALCHDLSLPPDAPARAQAALGGGPGPHWT